MKGMKIIALILLASAISSIGKPNKIKIDKINAFFREFELLCSVGDKDKLANIISTSQQTWCFKELDNIKNNPNIIGIQIDIDSSSIIIKPKQIIISGMAYQKMKGGQRSGEVQMDFIFERRGERLILVDTKSPSIESNNLLIEIGANLGNRMKNAINRGDKTTLVQILGKNNNRFKSDDLTWVFEAITNDNILVESYRVSMLRSKIVVTFTMNKTPKQSHSLNLVIENHDGVPKYSLAKSTNIAPNKANQDCKKHKQHLEKGRVQEARVSYFTTNHYTNANALFKKGYSFHTGTGVEKNYKKAAELYLLAAKQGHAGAQHNLGLLYNAGNGVKQNNTKAIKWFTLSAEQGNAQSQYSLGCVYRDGLSIQQDYQKALFWFERAAKQDLPIAQYAIGCMFSKGQGVAKNKEKSLQWLLSAARRGVPQAQVSIGYAHKNGIGVNKDINEAIYWYKKAALQNWSDAQLALGTCYIQGQGVERNPRRAVDYFKMAANQGHGYAQNNMGWCYEKGVGVNKDPTEAVKWYRLSAAQGIPEAQYSLGVCYTEGIGVAKNNDEAIKYFSLAAKKGHKKSIAKLTDLCGKMSHSESTKKQEQSGGHECFNPIF